jgi:hypothetical protein
MKIKIKSLTNEQVTVKLLSRPSNRRKRNWSLKQEREFYEALIPPLQRLAFCNIRYIDDAGEEGLGLTSCNGVLALAPNGRNQTVFISDFEQYQIRNIAETLNHFREVTLSIHLV